MRKKLLRSILLLCTFLYSGCAFAPAQFSDTTRPLRYGGAAAAISCSIQFTNDGGMVQSQKVINIIKAK